MSRKRHTRRREISHTEDWLMTYADVITLLLCFFAITIVTTMPKKEIPPVATPQEVTKPVAEQKPPLQEPLPAPDLAPSVTTNGDLPFHDTVTDIQTAPEPAPQVETQAAPAPPPVAKPVPAEPVKLEQKGDRITTVELPSAAFFDSGSATLTKSGEEILRKLAAELKDEKYKGYRITVEGHTDDTPIRTAQFPSNWELSTGRASSVVRFFLGEGMPADSLRAAGYADTFPKAPNRDASGHAISANQAENRRVVIKLEKIDKAD